ncbi:MAG: hypothetical protein RR272_04475, partial [Synergistaceae bacterium]
MLKNGLYEQIINKLLKNEIDSSEGLKNITARNIDKAEATKIVTSYLSSIIEKGLNTIDTQESTNTLIAFANDIVSLIKNKTKNCDFDSMYIEENNNSAQQLLSCYDKRDNISTINNQITIPRPETSLSQSSLFTNAVHEPQLASEFKKEIPSCDSIDILVSFIKWSGLRAIIDELREFTDNGGNLRVITTSYMGATDPKALKELSKFKNT